MHAVASEFCAHIAQRIEESRQLLAARWFEQLKRVVPVAENEIFPGGDLLGQIPTLIHELARFIKAPEDGTLAANAVITARAAEIGHLRYAQRASLQQVLREYHGLRTTVAAFIRNEISHLQLQPAVDEVIALMERLETVIDLLQQTTVDTFVAEYTETITQHASRLEGFNRLVTHELRQPLGVLQFGVKLLRSIDAVAAPQRREQILTTVDRNVTRLDDTLKKLLAVSRSGADTGQLQRVDLVVLSNEVVVQSKEMADSRGVRVEVSGDLPKLTTDSARLELVLANLVSNAIKYSDPRKADRFVQITPAIAPRSDISVLAIRDNGIGIAESDLRSIFARFYRGHPERDRELGASGLGLGLAIVADCVDALKGDIHVESSLGEGTTFFLELPRESMGN